MSLVLIAGIVGISVLILYFISGLEKEHYLLRLLSIFFVLFLFVLAAKTTIDQDCEIKLNYSTEVYTYGNNITGVYADPNSSAMNGTYLFEKSITNNYDLFCEPAEANTNVIFYNLIVSYIAIFFIYVFVFLGYKVLVWAGKITPKKRK